VSQQPTVIVIGAGVGGLATAARLAATGATVTVLEQADTYGGKLGLIERDGFRFDTGPHLLTLPHVLHDTFAATGADLADYLTLRRLDPVARYRFADGTWWDHRATDAELFDAANALRPGNGKELQRFLARGAAMWEATREPFLESALDGPKTLLKLSSRLRDVRTIAPGRTLRALTTSMISDPRLVAFVDRYATYTGSDPRQAPAVLASILHVEHHFGAWYVEGGLRQIGSALMARCEALGVSIQMRSDVAQIVISNGKASGVELADGRRLEADVVVANVDATHLYRDLLRDSPQTRRVRRSIERTSHSLSGFVICLAVESSKYSGPAMAHHTVLFPSRYDDEFDALFARPPRLVDDPTVYISVPNDPTLSPTGTQAWFVLVNAPRHRAPRGGSGNADQSNADKHADGIDWTVPGLAESYAGRVLALMAERGIDVRNAIMWRELRTPADLEMRTRSVGGSIYGTSSNGAAAAFLRPANRSPLPGLFLVGGSSHPGGGIPLVLMSAAITANLVRPQLSSR
jgi:phytoene desaturase